MSMTKKALEAELLCVRAERQRAQEACEQMGDKITELRAAIKEILLEVLLQDEPSVDRIHDICNKTLKM